ncbi:MAG: translation initiation factor IF-6 [Candidatus Lokiarchaeota archaeon]
MTIIKTKIFGGSLIGVYMEVNNNFLLYPPNIKRSELTKFRVTFDNEFYPFTLNNSVLLGVYIASNKYGIILPHILNDEERSELNSFLDHFDTSIEMGILNSIDNAYGNLILCNDKGAIISSLLRDYKSQIEDILNVETVIFDFAGTYLPGSVGLANNNGCLVHPLSTDEEIEFISSILKVDTDVSTINRGIPYLSSGAIVTDENGAFGEYSTGPELARLTNVLKL